MSFTDSLLLDIQNKGIPDFEQIIDRCRNAETIGIWGTGLAGTMIYEALKQQGMEAGFFLDNDVKKIGTILYGKEVKGITQIPFHTLVIIAANVKYKIHEQLEKLSIEYIYIDPGYLYNWNRNINVKAIIEQNRVTIDTVYNMLEDDFSKKVYRNVLLHRVIHEIKLIWDIYDEHQYFANDIVKKAKGCFVDCGAYQGDTLKNFLSQIGNSDYRYFALEADSHNYEMLRKYCKENSLKNVYPLNIGVWDKKEDLYFCDDSTKGDVSGKVSKEGEVKVAVDSIDHMLLHENISFIKMDIEGAEINALKGARKSIVKNKPILAISAYHELEHLWQIPMLIKEIDKNYRIYFRHHMWNMADTVCYAIMG